MAGMELPAFHGDVSFNAHHSPMGAYFSFTCGHFGTRGGLGAELGQPADQDLYIGVRDGDRYTASPLRCLPFFEGAQAGNSENVFLVEQAKSANDRAIRVFAQGEIRRHYGWGTDRWTTPDMGFAIYTPFGTIHDPAGASARQMRDCLLPAIAARLVVDNRHGTETKTGCFAVRFGSPGVRILDEGLAAGRVGFGHGRALGVAARLVDLSTGAAPADVKPFVFLRWHPDAGIGEPDNPVHLLGNCPGIGFEVPAGKQYAMALAIGCYIDGTVTTRLEGRYLYTRYFGSLEAVLDEALDRSEELAKAAEARDMELLESRLSADQQFLLAHATRSYYGNTQLLDIAHQPYWVVNEGEYRMLNKLDAAADQVFWELRHNPWVVRNVLDGFIRHYGYHDQIKDPKTGQFANGGISFCHDQGASGHFAPFGHSSYELANLSGCFSQMTQEQLCNWILMAACYVARTGDNAWAASNAHIIRACGQSMSHRDHPDRDKRTGVMKFDSVRCGRGQETTTYDTADASLAQARGSLYLATKCFAAYLGLSLLNQKLYEATGDIDYETTAEFAFLDAAGLAETVCGQMTEEGFLPALLEKDSAARGSRILPAIEGLVYPLYWDIYLRQAEASRGLPDGARIYNPRFGELVEAFKHHTQTLLEDREGRNRFGDGGLRLSSSSDHSWMSKIALFQHVIRMLFGLERGDDNQKAADAAHVRWQTQNSSAYWAMSDQMVNGVAKGSRYCARCVTAALWLDE